METVFADGGYAGKLIDWAKEKAHLTLQIIKRPRALPRFEPLPRRWVVGRTFAWLGRCRRLAKDFENMTRNALSFLKLASIRLMTRRLCNQ